jgi:nucleoid-associated protein YgaU
MADSTMANIAETAKLVCLMPGALGTVWFDFHPDSITFQRRALTVSRPTASSNGGSPAGASPSIFQGAAGSDISIREAILTGMTTKPRCDTLLNWMSPGGGMLGALAGGAISAISGGKINLATKLPPVTFTYGPPEMGFMYQTVVSSASIHYTRFTKEGIPVRAKVDLTLKEQPSLLGSLPTNPTSGGLPGRSSHTVSAGENLQSVAVANYGTPALWRRIAETNDIDDPLRVRPGQGVYLPNPDELVADRDDR